MCRTQSWFQFNDEAITKIRRLDSKSKTKTEIIEIKDDDEK